MKLNKDILTNMISEAIESVYDNERLEQQDGVEETNKEMENPLNDPINHSVKESKKMVIRMTEQDLHAIISESVNRILENRYQGKDIDKHFRQQQIDGAWKIQDKKKKDEYYRLKDKAEKDENKNVRDTHGKASMKAMKKNNIGC